MDRTAVCLGSLFNATDPCILSSYIVQHQPMKYNSYVRKRIIQKEYQTPEELRQILLRTSPELRKKAVVDWLADHDVEANEEDVIILKGCIPVLRDDTTFDYPESRLEWLLDSVSNIIRKHSRPIEPVMDTRHVDDHYDHESGWDGKEGMPWTVAEAWDRYGFVDFRGHDVSDPSELAAMWSIYRNPAIEYSHIVLLKNSQIVHQTMMTSGLYSLSLAVPVAGIMALEKRFKGIDFDSMYILHNHPDKDDAISPADLSVAAGYHKAFGDRFKASIVLEKTGFQLMEPIGKPGLFSRKFRFKASSFPYAGQRRKVHEPAPVRRLTDEDMEYDGRLIDWIRQNKDGWQICRSIAEGRTSGTAIAYMDSEHRLIDIQPFNAGSHTPAYAAELIMRQKASDAILVTNDEKQYEKLKKNALSAARHGGSPLRDIILVLPESYQSLRMEEREYMGSDSRDIISSRTYKDIAGNKGKSIVADTGIISITERMRRNAIKKSKSMAGGKGNERC